MSGAGGFCLFGLVFVAVAAVAVVRHVRTIRARDRRLTTLNALLVRLAGTTGCGKQARSFPAITEAAAGALEVDRAGIWLLSRSRTKIRLVDLCDRRKGTHDADVELPASKFPAYFGALENGRFVSAEDARTDPRTREFESSYLRPLGIDAVLNAPVRRGGRVDGFVCFERIGGRRRWEPEEQAFAASIADLVALTLESDERCCAEESSRGLARRLDPILESAGEGILGLDVEGAVTFLNPAASRMLGWGSDDLVGRNSHVAFHHTRPDGSPYPASECPIYAAFHDGRVYRGETEVFWRRDGTAFPVEYVSTPIRDAGGALAGAVVAFNDITERRRAVESLRLSEERHKLVVRATNDAVYDLDMVADEAWLSENMAGLFGYVDSRIRNAWAWWTERMHPEDRDRALGSAQEAFGRRDEVWAGEYRFRKADGSWAHILDRGFIRYDEAGRPVRWIGAFSDLTQRRQLEDQLRQSQKMEAIGRLAGGVAHDFNNLLTVIGGYGELLLVRLPAEGTERAAVEEIRTAAERAAGLTRQLLAFSRKQILQPRVLDLNAVVSGVEKMLRRLVREDVELTVALGSGLPPVRADVGQIEQVLLNLVVNARDAIPNGGKIAIGTAAVAADGNGGASMAALTVSDTGVGMTAEVRSHLFEPFFTTKPEGKGTGLGLATVYGIVQRSGGRIEVESEPGRGSTFRIRLPAVAPAVDAPASGGRPAAPAARGTGMILLAEDDRQVRALAARTLRETGYTVLEAGDGVEALAVLEGGARPDLVITDMVMPRLGGRDLAERIRLRWPGVKILYVTGYTDDNLLRVATEDHEPLLLKPFASDVLAGKVREVLDTKS